MLWGIADHHTRSHLFQAVDYLAFCKDLAQIVHNLQPDLYHALFIHPARRQQSYVVGYLGHATKVLLAEYYSAPHRTLS